jgi:hypothetical protein
LGRTQARITIPFRIPLDPGQVIAQNIMFLSVQRIGGFSNGKVRAFLNGSQIFEADWPIGRWTPVGFDKEVSKTLIKTDGSLNTFEVRVEQGFFDGLNTWEIFSQLTYNGNTVEPPTEPPSTEPPIVEDPTQDNPPPEHECDPLDIQCKLFGDTGKVLTTVTTIAGVGLGLYGLSLVVKLFKGK